MTNDLESRLRQIFSQLFRIRPAELDDGVRRGELHGWDSLGHLDLVCELESQFSVTINAESALEIDTFGAAKRIVASLLRNA